MLTCPSLYWRIVAVYPLVIYIAPIVAELREAIVAEADWRHPEREALPVKLTPFELEGVHGEHSLTSRMPGMMAVGVSGSASISTTFVDWAPEPFRPQAASYQLRPHNDEGAHGHWRTESASGLNAEPMSTASSFRIEPFYPFKKI